MFGGPTTRAHSNRAGLETELLAQNPVRIGIVGAGKMGLLHATVLSSTGRAKIVGVCERGFALRRFLPRLFKHAVIVKDIQGLTKVGLDAVYVTTPISSHFAVASQVIKARIADHIFVEKTLTSSFRDSLALAELQRGRGVGMVGYNRRFGSTFQKARSLYEGGLIGEAASFEAFAFSSDFEGNQLEVEGGRGGVLRDLGSHSIDVARWFFGELEVVKGTYSHIEGGAEFKVTTRSGADGVIRTSWSRPGYRLPEIGLSVVGPKGSLQVNDDSVRMRSNDQKSEWYRPSLHDDVPFLIGGPEYYREDDSFLDLVSGSSRPIVDFQSAAKTDLLIEQAMNQQPK